MKKLRITVGKKTYDVMVEVLGEDPPAGQSAAPSLAAAPAVAAAPPASSAPAAGAASPGAVTSPMAGVVKSVLVSAGDEVTAGTVLIVLEAMKMENKITASHPGTVGEVKVQEGQSVVDGQELLTLA